MLTALSIRDIVLIEKLDISLGDGMTVLTGETGAGKSILLDAFGLALGARGNAALVRSGQAKGVVTAAFHLEPDHAVLRQLDEHGLGDGAEVVVRRVQTKEGVSRAFINDQPVGVNLLKQIGAKLAEIHGQHDDRALMDSDGHRQLLDAYGGLQEQCRAVADAWETWSAARRTLEDHESSAAKAAAEQDYLQHVVAELRELAPEPDEEDGLAARRQMMMHGEQICESIDEVLSAFGDEASLGARLNSALRKLERRRDQAVGLLDDVCETLDRLLAEADEAQRLLEWTKGQLQFNPDELERTEERLFKLRAASRKHGVPVADLPDLADRFEGQLQSIADGGRKLAELRSICGVAEKDYIAAAEELGDLRMTAAQQLDAAVAAELAPLRLDNARFFTRVSSDAGRAGPTGMDRVVFEVSTNPGTSLQPLAKVASGGELSRFMLALRAVLARCGSAPTLIFDEIDTGVGGAVADAVGVRMSGLAEELQVLAVTHSPQVAARAGHHLLISKMETVGDGDQRMVTRVTELQDDSRREEIARMLSAAEVTEEARAQADRLLRLTG